MCMSNYPNQVKKFLAKHKGKSFITAYKVVSRYQEEKYSYLKVGIPKLMAPFIGNKTYKVGYNFSNSEAKRACTTNIDIKRGIHVCLTQNEAKCMAKQSSLKRVVSVKVYIKDLIGVGRDSKRAVFKKIYINKKDYENAVRG